MSIPRAVLDEAGLSLDSLIEMTVEGAAIVLRKLPVQPRDGWAEDAASIVDGNDDREWVEADLDAH